MSYEGSNQLSLFKMECLDDLSDDQLLKLRAALDVEMRRRGLALSVGAVAEQLAIEFFNSTPGCPNLLAAPTGTANVDAISRKGERYSIKSVCKGKKTGTIYPDPDDPDKQLFEFVLIVRLNEDWTLNAIYELDWPRFVEKRSWDKRMGAWYLSTSRRVLGSAKEYNAERL